jgi:hypothetical protein
MSVGVWLLLSAAALGVVGPGVIRWSGHRTWVWVAVPLVVVPLGVGAWAAWSDASRRVEQNMECVVWLRDHPGAVDGPCAPW